MDAVVTGASGFIGSHVAEALERSGWTVRRVGRRTHSYADATGLRAAFAGAELVVHAAGATRAVTDAELVRANVDVTRAVCDAMPEGARLLFVSSQAAAGPARSLDEPVREDDEPRPIEAYGASKLQAERVVRAGCPGATIVRPAAVYGPRDRDFIALFRLAKLGVAIHPANRERWVSIVYVRDLVDGVVAAALSPVAAGRTYFMAQREPVTWAMLFETAARVAERRLWADVNVASAAVDLGARLGDLVGRVSGKAPLLSTQKVALSKADYWICSPARARNEIGWVTTTGLEEGLRQTIASTTSRAGTSAANPPSPA